MHFGGIVKNNNRENIYHAGAQARTYTRTEASGFSIEVFEVGNKLPPRSSKQLNSQAVKGSSRWLVHFDNDRIYSMIMASATTSKSLLTLYLSVKGKNVARTLALCRERLGL